MPGLSSLVNKAVAGDASIQLFYNTQNQNLALILMDGKADPQDPDSNYKPATDARPGILMDGTSIAATEFQGTNLVVAVTAPVVVGTAERTKNDVAIVSPVYKKLADTFKDHFTVAISSSPKQSWVAFLEGVNAAEVQVAEVTIKNTSKPALYGVGKVLYNSQLAAYYDASHSRRFIIYQDAAAPYKLVEFQPDSGSVNPITGTNGAKGLTPVTVAQLGGVVYLYYIDSTNAVYRVTKTGGDWASGMPVGSTQKVADGSDLTAMTANGVVHLFYQPKDEDTYNFTHSIDAPSS